MRSQLSKLVSYAKTLGKHIWDQNKHKIIKKGFKIIKNKVGDGNKKYVGIIEDSI
mgnify:CR=1